MSTYKRGDVYWYEFEYRGTRVRESTYQGNDKKARHMESAHRSRLVAQSREKDAARERLGCTDVQTCHECEELFNADKAVRKDANVFCTPQCAAAWGKARSMPTLRGFLTDRFMPDAEVKHKETPNTIAYYRGGVSMLLRSSLIDMRLDDVTGEHASQFAAEFGHLSPSGINMGLRTLRRALNLACDWGQLEKSVKIVLAKGEVQPDRVLTEPELETYFCHCPQPWRDAARIIAEEGMRPGEVFVLRWECLRIFEEEGGKIKVLRGKTKAARRTIPMTPRVSAILKSRHETAGCPSEGWVFPSRANCGHLETQTAKRQHAAALKGCKVEPFVPYVLRHTALTRLAEAARGDVFALAKIAGHSSITISQKYVHPEAETIDGVFSRLSGGSLSLRVPTKSPTIVEAGITLSE